MPRLGCGCRCRNNDLRLNEIDDMLNELLACILNLSDNRSYSVSRIQWLRGSTLITVMLFFCFSVSIFMCLFMFGFANK